MSYTAQECVSLRLNSGATDYYFRPGNLSYISYSNESRQVVTQCESGVIVVAQLTSDSIRFYEFIVQNLPAADDTAGVTVRGYTNLEVFITSVANWRMTPVQLKLAGYPDTDGNFVDVRYWSSAIKRNEGPMDNFSGKLTFRQEVTSQF